MTGSTCDSKNRDNANSSGQLHLYDNTCFANFNTWAAWIAWQVTTIISQDGRHISCTREPISKTLSTCVPLHFGGSNRSNAQTITVSKARCKEKAIRRLLQDLVCGIPQC